MIISNHPCTSISESRSLFRFFVDLFILKILNAEKSNSTLWRTCFLDHDTVLFLVSTILGSARMLFIGEPVSRNKKDQGGLSAIK